MSLGYYILDQTNIIFVVDDFGDCVIVDACFGYRYSQQLH